MKTSKQLREEIGAKCDTVQAILDVAEKDGRDLSAQEKADIDRINGRGKPGEAGYIKGEIAELEDELDRVERIENRQAELAQARVATGAGNINPGQGHPSERELQGRDEDEPRVARIRIPAKARFRYGTLKAYHGPHAEKTAYMAGMFFLATLGQNAQAAKWCTDNGIDITFRGAALAGNNNELGGYLVPDEMEQAIIDLREVYGVFRREAKQTPMAGDTKNHPKRTGGPATYFVGENEEVTAAEKGWGNVKLVARKLACLLKFSSELSEDAIISIGDDLTKEIAWAMAYKEDLCGFVGDGSSTYGGMVGVVNAVLAGAIVTAAGGNVSFETLDLADFEACIGKVPEYADTGNAKWYISRAGWAASMCRLMDGMGGNTSTDIANGPPKREFLGYPVVLTQVLNKTLGSDVSQPKAIFGDLQKGALFGTRRGMSIMISPHRFMELDQLAILGTERFDITVHEIGTATEAGALVVLKTAAA